MLGALNRHAAEFIPRKNFHSYIHLSGDTAPAAETVTPSTAEGPGRAATKETAMFQYVDRFETALAPQSLPRALPFNGLGQEDLAVIEARAAQLRSAAFHATLREIGRSVKRLFGAA